MPKQEWWRNAYKQPQETFPVSGDVPILGPNADASGVEASHDPVAKLLVRKYGVPPEAALTAARKYAGESAAQDTSQGVASEAMAGVVEREQRRIQMMDRMVTLMEARKRGEPLDPNDEAWLTRVDARRAELVRQRALDIQARESKALEEKKLQAMTPDAITGASERVAMTPRQAATMSINHGKLRKATAPAKYIPPDDTASALMKSFGLDQGSATELAARLKGQ
jgi:hypothetical protein